MKDPTKNKFNIALMSAIAVLIIGWTITTMCAEPKKSDDAFGKMVNQPEELFVVKQDMGIYDWTVSYDGTVTALVPTAESALTVWIKGKNVVCIPKFNDLTDDELEKVANMALFMALEVTEEDARRAVRLWIPERFQKPCEEENP